MIMRRSLAVLGLAATAAAAAASPAAASTAAQAPRQGSIGIRLLTAPVSERANPLARLYIIDHLAPGTTIHRRIQVANMSRSAAHLTAYTAAASIAHGQFLFAPGHQQNLMTTWVHLSRPVLLLAAGQRARERVTIRVPRNARRRASSAGSSGPRTADMRRVAAILASLTGSASGSTCRSAPAARRHRTSR
jgi:hypothetical protein